MGWDGFLSQLNSWRPVIKRYEASWLLYVFLKNVDVFLRQQQQQQQKQQQQP